jgi:hypothetical protein
MQYKRLSLIFLLPIIPLQAADVLQHHLHSSRDGHYIDPLMTQSAAANIHADPTFSTPLPGPTYAQPLYIANGAGGIPTLIVATEQNTVLAIDASDGSWIWTTNLGTPMPLAQLPCGNIDPFGITGTPVIDPATRTIYLDAMMTADGGVTQKHLIFALSLDDGSILPGWPVDPTTISFLGAPFDSTYQGQRSALLLSSGYLYVPFGGLAGDCGNYHGWVVSVPVNNPSQATAWATGAIAGGIWAPGGMSSDGTSVFVATGNTEGAYTWMGGEAVLRLGPGATYSGNPTDYYVPSNWEYLDGTDLDLGGSGPILVDVPGATPSKLAVALGKNGVAYLLDRTNLGGLGTGDGTVGEGLFSAQVSIASIINAAAAYRTALGSYVVFESTGLGFGCPGTPGDLVALRITPTAPPTFTVAWCANNLGGGSPVATTTDGTSNAMVWTVGAEYTNQLHAFDGDTGQIIFAGGGPNEQMGNVQHFQVPIEVNGRIFVAGDDELYAFTVQ